jgi:hypothetical protein
MESQPKYCAAYTDLDGKNRFITLTLPKQIQAYEKWRKTRDEIENGKWKGDNLVKAVKCMEKCYDIFTYQKEKDLPMECECGCMITRCTMARHRATSKHKKLMESKPTAASPPVALAETDLVCECGMIVSKANYSRHIKNSRHLKAMEHTK